VREVAGEKVHGFTVYVGGGLGAQPFQAKLYSDFVPANDMLPLTQAIARVFARLGEKKNRARARIKFLIAELGLEEFKRLVAEEIGKLHEDRRWTEELEKSQAVYVDKPLKPGSELKSPDGAEPGLLRWLRTNVRPQSQAGYSMVEVFLPLGDISADQARALANLSRRYIKDTIRTTVEQNLLLRWVSSGDVVELYGQLEKLGLAEGGAGRLADITACPGTDSCKLGISSSRGLAALMHEKFNNGMSDIADRNDLKIKISGCFNSCGQHHIADIGLFGSVNRKGSRTAPVFQVVVGGTMRNNANSYGLAIGRVPAVKTPDVIRKLSTFYTEQKQGDESFNEVVRRVGKARIKEEIAEYEELPIFDEAPGLYQDNRQPWEYKKDVGVGECAGAVVDQAEFMLEDADRLQFEATLLLDEGRYQEAASKTLEATRKAADGLLSTRGLLLSDNYDTVAEFRRVFYDEGRFHASFAENFFRATEEGVENINPDRARGRVDETTLFLEMAQTVFSQA
jgi:sulfite reductase (ferredoxin)